MHLTSVMTGILRALMTYRFLTNRQLATLQLGHRDTIRKSTALLSKGTHALLCCQRFAVDARLGRQEHIYRLHRRAGPVLESLFQLPAPPLIPRTAVFAQDAHHRKAVIDFRLQLDHALSTTEYVVTTWTNYFDMTGGNHRKKPGPPLHAGTRMLLKGQKVFIPDTILVLSSQGSKQLFALEMVRGNKTARTLAQVRRHMQALAEGIMSDRFLGQKQDAVVLFLFERSELMTIVCERLEGDEQFRSFRDHFLFATIADTARNVLKAWKKIGVNDCSFELLSGRPAFRRPTNP